MSVLLIVSEMASLQDGLPEAWKRKNPKRTLAGLVVLGVSSDGSVESMSDARRKAKRLQQDLKLSSENIMVLPSLTDLQHGYSGFDEAFFLPLLGREYDHKKHQFLHLPQISFVTINSIYCKDHLGFSPGCLEEALLQLSKQSRQPGVVGIVHYFGLTSFASSLIEQITNIFPMFCVRDHLRFSISGNAELDRRAVVQSIGTKPGTVSFLEYDALKKCARVWTGAFDKGWKISGHRTYRILPGRRVVPADLPAHGTPFFLGDKL